ncbi:MAG: hypothetical protein HY914_08525 [Desulfomonile tiedjei]|nr:hypothetical protein [Desulfomonile tiedjei]
MACLKFDSAMKHNGTLTTGLGTIQSLLLSVAVVFVCSLFARRAYHVRGILWLPSLCGKRSRVWLLVGADQRLDQIAKQIGKLEDVQHVRWRSADGDAFTQREGLFRPY